MLHNIFTEIVIHFLFRIILQQYKYIIFGQFNAYLLNKNIKTLSDPKLLVVVYMGTTNNICDPGPQNQS